MATTTWSARQAACSYFVLFVPSINNVPEAGSTSFSHGSWKLTLVRWRRIHFRSQVLTSVPQVAQHRLQC